MVVSPDKQLGLCEKLTRQREKFLQETYTQLGIQIGFIIIVFIRSTSSYGFESPSEIVKMEHFEIQFVLS